MPGAIESVQEILEHEPEPLAFSFSPFLSTTYAHKLAPPPRSPCRAFLQGHCPLGSSCPDPHTDATGRDVNSGSGANPSSNSGNNTNSGSNYSSFNSLVCKHWLRGLCKKGESCEFLHEYNLRKMPECNFFVRNGYCSNGDECLYLHIDPLSKLPPCPHYEKGFCPLGPNCAKKHVRRKMCPYYLAGFCPDGKACKEGTHPKWRNDLGDPVAKSNVQIDNAEHGLDGRLHDDDGDRDGRNADGGSQRDRGFGRDHGRDRDRQRDGDHGGQRRWRGGRGGRGGRGNRRYRDRH